MTPKRSIFSRFFLGIWHFIDGARKLALNLVFLLIVYLLLMALIDTEDMLVIQPDTALVLQPYGDVVEQYSGTPLDFALQQATEIGAPGNALTGPHRSGAQGCG